MKGTIDILTAVAVTIECYAHQMRDLNDLMVMNCFPTTPLSHTRSRTIIGIFTVAKICTEAIRCPFVSTKLYVLVHVCRTSIRSILLF